MIVLASSIPPSAAKKRKIYYAELRVAPFGDEGDAALFALLTSYYEVTMLITVL